MIISTKGRYGLRAVFVLAQKQAEGPLSIKYISEDQSISETYLEQLFSTLRKAGIVKSVRGAGGGYILAEKPCDITVGRILEALEGPLAPAECVKGSCAGADDCSTHAIWMRIYDGISNVVNSISLQDMLDDCEEKSSSLNHSRCK